MANVAVGLVTDEAMPSEFVSCLLALMAQRYDVIKNRVITVQGFAGRLDIGRHVVAESFLRSTDAEQLLMVDTDMVFEVADFDRLVNTKTDDLAVLSGLYARIDGSLAAWQWEGEGMRNMKPEEFKHRMVKVGSVGLGFTLVHRNLLQKMKDEIDGPLPYFDIHEPGPKEARMADDSSFCWRVALMGGSVYVDTKVLVGHLKRVTMTPRLDIKELEVPKKELIIP